MGRAYIAFVCVLVIAIIFYVARWLSSEGTGGGTGSGTSGDGGGAGSGDGGGAGAGSGDGGGSGAGSGDGGGSGAVDLDALRAQIRTVHDTHQVLVALALVYFPDAPGMPLREAYDKLSEEYQQLKNIAGVLAIA